MTQVSLSPHQSASPPQATLRGGFFTSKSRSKVCRALRTSVCVVASALLGLVGSAFVTVLAPAGLLSLLVVVRYVVAVLAVALVVVLPGFLAAGAAINFVVFGLSGQ